MLQALEQKEKRRPSFSKLTTADPQSPHPLSARTRPKGSPPASPNAKAAKPGDAPPDSPLAESPADGPTSPPGVPTGAAVQALPPSLPSALVDHSTGGLVLDVRNEHADEPITTRSSDLREFV